jgi:DNA-binding NarL/FixJ family response regulator
MRVLVADDHALFRDGLRSLLSARGVEVVAEAENGRLAVELCRELDPEIVLMDLFMPEMDGLAATRILSAELPQVKVIILTASDQDADLFEAIKSGAQGYLVKNLQSDHFFALLEGVSRGEPAFSPNLARKVLAEFAQARSSRPASRDPDALTEREGEVLQYLVRGVTSTRDLAAALGVSENTVKFHLRNILDKLHLKNRAQVVSFALRRRMVPDPEMDPDD